MCSSSIICAYDPLVDSAAQWKVLSLLKIECSSAKKGEGLVNRREYSSVMFDTFDSGCLKSSSV